MKALLDALARSILRGAIDRGSYRPSSKKQLDAVIDLRANGLMTEHDNYPGVYTATKEGESALDKWDRIPSKTKAA